MTGNQSSIPTRRREFVCVDAISTSDSGWGGALNFLPLKEVGVILIRMAAPPLLCCSQRA